MSMSQEEIESLMNGIDLAEDEASAAEEENTNSADMSENDIADLIAQTDLSEETSEPVKEPVVEVKKEEVQEVIKEEVVDNSSVDDILKELEEAPKDEVETTEDLDVDSILKELDAKEENISSNENIDDILSSIENMDINEENNSENVSVEKIEEKAEEKVDEKAKSSENEKSGKEWAEHKIEEGVFPFPADDDTKVVSQLSEVANDTEEKALQIFDVLSLVLDNNDDSSKGIKQSDAFVKQQIILLKKLNSKFPNISEFKENLDLASTIEETNKNLLASIDAENMKIFEAMELMQFNDINRQKIERVMSVIRKLSSYLNNLFEDDRPENEIIVAKHISGDDTDDLLADEDLESLISEFGN